MCINSRQVVTILLSSEWTPKVETELYWRERRRTDSHARCGNGPQRHLAVLVGLLANAGQIFV
jgi:hypothetical protein